MKNENVDNDKPNCRGHFFINGLTRRQYIHKDELASQQIGADFGYGASRTAI